MDKPLVDPKSFELAEHFLDTPYCTPTDQQKWQLAKAIQDAVESWFGSQPNWPNKS